jgi:hypothetical protein
LYLEIVAVRLVMYGAGVFPATGSAVFLPFETNTGRSDPLLRTIGIVAVFLSAGETALPIDANAGEAAG